MCGYSCGKQCATKGSDQARRPDEEVRVIILILANAKNSRHLRRCVLVLTSPQQARATVRVSTYESTLRTHRASGVFVGLPHPVYPLHAALFLLTSVRPVGCTGTSGAPPQPRVLAKGGPRAQAENVKSPALGMTSLVVAREDETDEAWTAPPRQRTPRRRARDHAIMLAHRHFRPPPYFNFSRFRSSCRQTPTDCVLTDCVLRLPPLIPASGDVCKWISVRGVSCCVFVCVCVPWLV